MALSKNQQHMGKRYIEGTFAVSYAVHQDFVCCRERK